MVAKLSPHFYRKVFQQHQCRNIDVQIMTYSAFLLKQYNWIKYIHITALRRDLICMNPLPLYILLPSVVIMPISIIYCLEITFILCNRRKSKNGEKKKKKSGPFHNTLV